MSIITSKCPRRYLQRVGLIPTPRRSQPRLSLGNSRANTLPLEAEELDPNQILEQCGPPNAGNGLTAPWPPLQQVIIE